MLVEASAQDGEPQELAGYAPEQLRWVTAPVVRSDGTHIADVSACLLEEPGGASAPLDSSTPFTLAGDIFESSGHADLVRVFVPFGLDRRRRATGVLEIGYHRTASRRPDRTTTFRNTRRFRSTGVKRSEWVISISDLPSTRMPSLSSAKWKRPRICD